VVWIVNHGLSARCLICVGQPYVRFTHALTSGGLPLSRVVGPCVMIVEEFGQLLAQAFIPLAFVAEHDGPFEQGLLKLLRQIAPKVRDRRAKDEEVTLGVAVPRDIIRRSIHDKT